MMLHVPNQAPQVSKNFYKIAPKKDIMIGVKPKLITTSKGLRHYLPDKRQCYFNNERKLQLYSVYTQGNCELECLANYTLERCGCLKFSMPSIYLI
jgi:acid-sensing ion channel, other